MTDTIQTSEDGRFRVILEHDTDADPSDRQGAGFVYYVETRNGRSVVRLLADEYDTRGADWVQTLLRDAVAHFNGRGGLDMLARYFRTLGCAFDSFEGDNYSGGSYVGITTPELAAEWGCDFPDVDLSEWRDRDAGDVYGYVIEEAAHWTSDTIGGPREMDTWETVDDTDAALWGMYGRDYAEETARDAFATFLASVGVTA